MVRLAGSLLGASCIAFSTAAHAIVAVTEPGALFPSLEVNVRNASGDELSGAVDVTLVSGSAKVQQYTLAKPHDAPNGWAFTSVGGTPLPQTFSYNADPFLDYAFGVTNNSAGTLSFTFSFLAPYVGGPYLEFRNSHASTITSVSGATVATNLNPLIHWPTLDGVPVAGSALGDGCAVAGNGSFTCDASGSTVVSPVLSAASGLFGVTLSWTLSPGDSYSLSGRVELAEIPEPGTFALLFAGLAGLLGIARRRLA